MAVAPTQATSPTQREMQDAGSEAVSRAPVSTRDRNPRPESARRAPVSTRRARQPAYSRSTGRFKANHKGRALVNDVVENSIAVREAQRQKKELMRQHDAILDRITRTGVVTEADKAILNAAGQQWTKLSEDESNATAELSKVGQAYKTAAGIRSRKIEAADQGVSNMSRQQGAQWLTMLSQTALTLVIAYQKYRLEKDFPLAHGQMPSRADLAGIRGGAHELRRRGHDGGLDMG